MLKSIGHRAVIASVLTVGGASGARADGPYPELASFTARAGLTVDRMVAAGISLASFDGVASAVDAYREQNHGRWLAADTAVVTARAALQLAQSSGTGVSMAQEAVDSAEATRTALTKELIAIVESVTSEPVADRLLLIYQNTSQWRLPLKYMVTSRAESEWALLRDALAEHDDASREGFDPPSWTEIAILQADAATATINAATALEDLPAAKAAWAQALSE